MPRAAPLRAFQGWAKPCKCLETRKDPQGFRRRRYRRVDGAVFRTIEVPLEVWVGAVRHDRVPERAAKKDRELARQALRAEALRMLAAGETPVVVARTTGLADAHVYRLRRTLKK